MHARRDSSQTAKKSRTTQHWNQKGKSYHPSRLDSKSGGSKTQQRPANPKTATQVRSSNDNGGTTTSQKQSQTNRIAAESAQFSTVGKLKLMKSTENVTMSRDKHAL